MAAYLELEDCKKHCRVDNSDDDDYITTLMDVVERTVEIELGADLSTYETETIMKPGIIHAMKILLSHFYNIRENVALGVSVVEIPFSYKYLLLPFKNYTIA